MQDLFGYKEDSMNATIRGNAQRVVVDMVSGNFYSAMGVQPQLGRPLQLSDDIEPGQGTVALISDALWEREFGRSPSVLGQIVKVNQSQFTIVGVNPRGFTGGKKCPIVAGHFCPVVHAAARRSKRQKSLSPR